jgi:hypothetical protein
MPSNNGSAQTAAAFVNFDPIFIKFRQDNNFPPLAGSRQTERRGEEIEARDRSGVPTELYRVCRLGVCFMPVLACADDKEAEQRATGHGQEAVLLETRSDLN